MEAAGWWPTWVRDLTDERYDVPEHPLFSSLSTVHKKDFYNPCEPSISRRFGPR